MKLSFSRAAQRGRNAGAGAVVAVRLVHLAI